MAQIGSWYMTGRVPTAPTTTAPAATTYPAVQPTTTAQPPTTTQPTTTQPATATVGNSDAYWNWYQQTYGRLPTGTTTTAPTTQPISSASYTGGSTPTAPTGGISSPYGTGAGTWGNTSGYPGGATGVNPNTIGGASQDWNYQNTPQTGTSLPTSKDALAMAALARLEQVGMGNNDPMGAVQRDRMYSAQSDASTAAAAQQQAALRRTTAAGGGSLYDPSHGAAEREVTAARQGANQAARREIDTDAHKLNWEAQFAANRLLAAQQSRGGVSSGNPYEYNSSGTGSGSSGDGGESSSSSGPQAYGGINYTQNNMTGTQTQQSAAQQQAARDAQWGSYYQWFISQGGSPAQAAAFADSRMK